MSAQRSQAREACFGLCYEYAVQADAGNAVALAALYTEDGVFDRMGQRFVGREAIRQVIAGRPVGVWTRHVFSDVHVDISGDGRSASGRALLCMQRGRDGERDIEEVRAEFEDCYALTAEGWRFRERMVRLLMSPDRTEPK